MALIFTEVFPTLKLEKSLQDLFAMVEVEKMTMTRQRNFIRIYIISDRLIQKAIIFQVEAEIKNQLFRGQPTAIKIYEKFCLSAQYNAEKLFHIYQDSIFLELKERPVILSMLRKTSLSYPNHNQILLTIDDSLCIQDKVVELSHYLHEVFANRCGFDVEIKIAYREDNQKKPRDDDAKIRARIHEATDIVRGIEAKPSGDAVPESIRVRPSAPNDSAYLVAEEDTDGFSTDFEKSPNKVKAAAES